MKYQKLINIKMSYWINKNIISFRKIKNEKPLHITFPIHEKQPFLSINIQTSVT